MSEEEVSLLLLQMTPGVGGGTIRQLINHFGSAQEILKQPPGKLKKLPGIGKERVQSIIDCKNNKQAEEIIKKAIKENIQLISLNNSEYSKRLSTTFDSPLLLFKKGPANLNSQKVLSVVGTRNATSYGLGFTSELIAGLKFHQPIIVSGLAYGIDYQAHYSALKEGLPTVGVLASGVNYIYPYKHKRIANDLLESGALISEYPPDIPPEPGNFPARNRIIAGLADAVIVVEAAKKGGALITAEIANSYQRDVFAVPGNTNHTYSQGCNALIRAHKANILTCPEDIEYILGWDKTSVQQTISEPIPDLEENELKVYQLLKKEKEQIIDEISWKTGITLNKLAVYLLNLEFKGYVKSLPGKKYKLS